MGDLLKTSGFFLIAGPCVIESREITFLVAKLMKEITTELDIQYIFKASFDKANRTDISSFRGLGMEEGLSILNDVRHEFGLQVITDVHTPEQVPTVAKYVDMLQIPAFLARQTDLVLAAVRTGLPVNIKKPQFASPFDMQNVVNKCKSVDGSQIMVCERGTVFGYNTLVVDMTALYEMSKFGCPVVFDATHSVQKPGGKGSTSDGNREYVRYLARAAVAVGVDGLFMEVHPEPARALSDGPSMIPLSEVKTLLVELLDIHKVIQRRKP